MNEIKLYFFELISGPTNFYNIDVIKIILNLFTSIAIGKIFGEKRHIGALRTILISFFTISTVPLPLIFLFFIIRASPEIIKPKPKANVTKLKISIFFLVFGFFLMFYKVNPNESMDTNFQTGVISIFFSIYSIMNYYILKNESKNEE